MSRTIYIAYPKIKEQPIDKDSLIDAVELVASRNENLVLQTSSNKYAKGNIGIARLKRSKRQTISLSPYGLVFTQDPDKDLVRILFEIAEILGAKVYSERLKPYASPDDWEERTFAYRNKRDGERNKYQKNKRIKILGWSIVVVILVLIAIIINTT